MYFEYTVEGVKGRYKSHTPYFAPDSIAEDAAEDFWHSHGGCDHEWPLNFTILIGGEDEGTYSVDVVQTITFSVQ
ncbi:MULTISPECIES: hypothetical protein [unclassified Photorhabdus]|uniref:hypothetical protein n=1 Tax=unclassified Photorhabdus TaxID=2620880 RepID=UPI000DCC7A53|nr:MULTISPECIES: hypothetical protein [unclassified Photorhabdus]RAW91960.1 hypothetical protein CKY05_23645 [Photorhabdus sp. S10-54]RAW92000.1 hypothetical protein CKY03_23590 [Photorhabdus sp. S9-53]RAW95682.1 hypothetical protein CKY04_23510 [Photorhabdus sp. S8-52]